MHHIREQGRRECRPCRRPRCSRLLALRDDSRSAGEPDGGFRVGGLAALLPRDYASGCSERRWEPDQRQLERRKKKPRNNPRPWIGLDEDNLNDARASRTALEKTANLSRRALELKKQRLVPRPAWGAGQSLFFSAPWRGFSERCWFSVLFARWCLPRSQFRATQMKCRVHPNDEAVGACVECGAGVCHHCQVTVQGRIYCRTCVESVLSSRLESRNITEEIKLKDPASAAAMSMLHTGLGQLYNGDIRKGITLIVSNVSAVILCILIGLAIHWVVGVLLLLIAWGALGLRNMGCLYICVAI